MLVLSRKVGEKIVIDDRVTITITRVSGGRVSVGIEAPHGMRIVRGELKPLPATQVEISLDQLEAIVRQEPRNDLPLDMPQAIDIMPHTASTSG
jgi:carbon storage regulator CsrA